VILLFLVLVFRLLCTRVCEVDNDRYAYPYKTDEKAYKRSILSNQN